MKSMKRILIASALVLTLMCSILLVGCSGGSSYDFKSLHNDIPLDVYPASTTKTDVVALNGFTPSFDSVDSLVVFTKTSGTTTTTTVYDYANNKTVVEKQGYSGTAENSFSYKEYDVTFEYNLNAIIVIEEYYNGVEAKTTTSTEVYDYNGTLILTLTEEENNAVKLGDNFVIAKDTLYYVSNGTIVQGGKINSYKIPSSIDNMVKSGNYIIDDNNDEIVVYDTSFNVVMNYEVPSYIENTPRFSIFSDFAIVQYEILADPISEDYDILDSNDKLYLKTIVLDFANKTEKEIEIDYIIEQGVDFTLYKEQYPDFENPYNDDIKYVAIVFEIVNKRVNSSSSSYEFVTIDRNGNIQKSLFNLENQISPAEKVMDAEGIENDVYVAQTATGYVYLNGLGEIIEHSGEYLTVFGDNFYSSKSKKLYDKAFNEVQNFKDYDSVNVYENYISLRKNTDDGTEYSVFANGGITALPQGATNVNFYDGCYTYSVTTIADLNAKTTYFITSANGTQLFTSDYYISLVDSHEGTYLFRTTSVIEGVSTSVYFVIK